MEYKIKQILPTVDISPRGEFIKVYRVTFEWNGMEDYIELPESEYSSDKVKELIEKKIAEHKKLLGK